MPSVRRRGPSSNSAGRPARVSASLIAPTSSRRGGAPSTSRATEPAQVPTAIAIPPLNGTSVAVSTRLSTAPAMPAQATRRQPGGTNRAPTTTSATAPARYAVDGNAAPVHHDSTVCRRRLCAGTTSSRTRFARAIPMLPNTAAPPSNTSNRNRRAASTGMTTSTGATSAIVWTRPTSADATPLGRFAAKATSSAEARRSRSGSAAAHAMHPAATTPAAIARARSAGWRTQARSATARNVTRRGLARLRCRVARRAAP
jgi:hypothetical protein